MSHTKSTLLVFALILSCIANAQNIYLVAGTGSTGGTGDGGPATAATMAPFMARPDNNGNVYIADALNYRIRLVKPSGIITTVAGSGVYGYSGDGGPATAATISYAQSVAIDAAGNLYIADWIHVRKVNTVGIITTIAGGGDTVYSGDGGPATAAGFAGITDIGLDNAGNLYIVDLWDHRIRKVNTSGIISTFAGGGTGNAVDGAAATSVGLGEPRSIAIDRSGNVFFTETGSNSIWKVNSAGILSAIIGPSLAGYSGDGGPATAARLNLFNATGSIAVDSAGNIFIGDGDNYRVRKINTSGIISTIAGCGLPGGGGDGGPATAAYFPEIYGVSVDKAGSIYVSDEYLVRKIAAVSTGIDMPADAGAEEMICTWPEPSNGNFNLVVNSASDQQAHISITDMVGRQIEEFTTVTNRQAAVTLDAPGIYVITAITGECTRSVKICVR